MQLTIEQPFKSTLLLFMTATYTGISDLIVRAISKTFLSCALVKREPPDVKYSKQAGV